MKQKAKPLSADEQFRMIMECRSSGLTDAQWCKQHDIKPGTFYNWVAKCRKRGIANIPASTGKQMAAVKQEIVKVEIAPPAAVPQEHIIEVEPILDSVQASVPTSCPTPAVASTMTPCQPNDRTLEVQLGECFIRIPNGTDPVLAELVIRLTGGMVC